MSKHDKLDLRSIPLGDLRPSIHNHRKHFSEAEVTEMADSIRSNGVLTPLSVRPHPDESGAFEIGAGETRYRAATLAGLAAVPCYVRDMDDITFRVLINIENLRRRKVHPVDVADGYRDLMELTGDDAPALAKRLGEELHDVYDRLQLLKLIPDAREMFLANRFTAGHAIEISRQTREIQEKLIQVGEHMYEHGPLWRGINAAGGLFDAEERYRFEQDPFFMLEPVTIAELKSWINTHVRFRAGEIEAPGLFAETIAKLDEAKESGQKVLAITYSLRIEKSIKGEGRIYGPEDWRRADGTGASLECEDSDRGLVVAGPHRGDMFTVCVAKTRCKIHFGERIRAAEKALRSEQATSKAASAGNVKAQKKLEKEEKARAALRAKQLRDAGIRDIARPMAHAAALLVVAKAKVGDCGVKGRVGCFVLDTLQADPMEFYLDPAMRKRIAKTGGADAVVRALAELILKTSENYGNGMMDDAKRLGVNVAKITKDAAAQYEKEAKAAENKAAA